MPDASKSNTAKTRVSRIPLLLNLLLVAAVIAAWRSGLLPSLEELGLVRGKASSTASSQVETPQASTPLRMKAIKPRRDAKTQVTVTQPAEVEEYYRVQLYADRPGTVTMIEKEMGDEVSQGEVLIEIRESPLGQVYKITSPIDGVTSSRTVDAGTFAPSAAIIPGALPLLTVAKIDIVTVTIYVPDVFTPFVSLQSLATIRNPAATDQPPIDTRLTRISPLARGSDRTLKVQVELFNETRQDYDELIDEEKAKDFASFKSRKPPEFPLNLRDQQAAELVPGMLYEMQLTLKEFANVPVIPSSSVIRRSGKTYVYEIVENKLVEVPVTLKLDDGTTAYAKKIRRQEATVLEEDFRGDESIAWGVAGDMQPGRTVDATVTEW